VSSYLAAQVSSHKEQNAPAKATRMNLVVIDVDVEGINVQFEIETNNPDSAFEQSSKFCIQYGSSFGVSDEMFPRCVTNIREALQRALSAHLAAQQTSSQAEVLEEVAVSGESEVREEEAQQPAPVVDVLSNSQVISVPFNLGPKIFDYSYDVGSDATTNAIKFCNTFWSTLETAFVEAGMTGVDESKCAVIVAEVTLSNIQSVSRTMKTAHEGGKSLFRAVSDGDDLEVERLLIAGADVEGVSSENTPSPLYQAALQGNRKIVELLLRSAANIEAKNTFQNHRTPLLVAVERGHLGAVEALLAAGADTEAVTLDDGKTSLIWAIVKGHTLIAKALISRGAAITAKTKAGYSALAVARQFQRFDIEKLLQEAGAGA